MTTQKKELIDKINKKEAKIGIIGIGYVGLPLMLRYAEVGFNVLGFDINKSVVDTINSGKSYIEHISSSEILLALKKGLIEATVDMKRINECDAVILCVPTPLNKNNEPDLSYVTNTLDSITQYLKEGQIISLESTTYPGTTEEEIVTRIERQNFRIGENYFVVYSPEREDPGNLDFETSTIPKVCGGHTKNCADVGVSLYSIAVNQVVRVSSTKVAEMTKLLENIQRAVNIGLVNEMKIIADKMGIDIFEVVDAASTKPFGFSPYYPGPGLGGHCIPIDPFYLTWKAKEFGVHTRFIELSGEINKAMPNYVLDKLKSALIAKKKDINNSKILVLGLAYKKNVDDVRESPSVEIMELLREDGAIVEYSDPHVQKFPVMRDHKFELDSIELSKKSLSEYDAVIISTDHDRFDYDLIKENSSLVVDCRGVYRDNFLGLIKS